MKLIRKEKPIPATIEIVDIYVANDGKEFKGWDAASACARYERKCKTLEDIQLIESKMVNTLEGKGIIKAFYINTDEEFHTVLYYLVDRYGYYFTEEQEDDGFKEVGWYCFEIIDGYGDIANTYPIYTLESYHALISAFMSQFD